MGDSSWCCWFLCKEIYPRWNPPLSVIEIFHWLAFNSSLLWTVGNNLSNRFFLCFTVVLTVNACLYAATGMSLSSDVFEPWTSTESWRFSLLSHDSERFFGKVVSIGVKTLSNTNLVALGYIKREKGSLPVNVRRAKTSLLYLSTTRIIKVQNTCTSVSFISKSCLTSVPWGAWAAWAIILLEK